MQDIRRWKNRRLLANLGNAIEAVCGPYERQGPVGDMLLAEGEAVLSAAGLEAATRRRTGTDEVLQRRARELAVTRDAPGATPAAAILERLDITDHLR